MSNFLTVRNNWGYLEWCREGKRIEPSSLSHVTLRKTGVRQYPVRTVDYSESVHEQGQLHPHTVYSKMLQVKLSADPYEVWVDLTGTLLYDVESIA